MTPDFALRARAVLDPPPGDGRTRVIHGVDVQKVYRHGALETHALRGVTVEIHRGEFLSIMGASLAAAGLLLAAETETADSLWKKVDDAINAIKNPAQRPKSREEAIENLKKNIPALDGAIKIFLEKAPNDPRRWKNFKQKDATEMLRVVRDEVFPHFRKLDGGTTFGEYMQDAQLMIQKPSLVVSAVNMIDKLPTDSLIPPSSAGTNASDSTPSIFRETRCPPGICFHIRSGPTGKSAGERINASDGRPCLVISPSITGSTRANTSLMAFRHSGYFGDRFRKSTCCSVNSWRGQFFSLTPIDFSASTTGSKSAVSSPAGTRSNSPNKSSK